MHVTFMQCACHDEHHIVDHVAVGAVVQEFGQGLISLRSRQHSVRPTLAYMPGGNSCSHDLRPLATVGCVEEYAMLQCHHDVEFCIRDIGLNSDIKH